MEHESQSQARFAIAHRRHGLAFVASIAAHVLVIGGLLLLIPEAEHPHHDWVLAYLVEFDRPGAPGAEPLRAMPAAAPCPSPSRADAAPAARPPASHPHPRRAARAEAKPPARAPEPQTADITAAPESGAAAISAGRESASPADAGSADSGGQVVSASPIRRRRCGGRGRRYRRRGGGFRILVRHMPTMDRILSRGIRPRPVAMRSREPSSCAFGWAPTVPWSGLRWRSPRGSMRWMTARSTRCVRDGVSCPRVATASPSRAGARFRSGSR